MAQEDAQIVVPQQDVIEVDLATQAGVTTEEEKRGALNPIEGLISFDQLVMNFIQQYDDVKEEYLKLQEALDNMHYTSTITKISLEELQVKRDLMNKLSGAVEALSLYKKHVDPTVTEREFTFADDAEVTNGDS
ncbi:MAG: hypothetical protein CBC89_04990 [Euryarchaeota archaeon TMED129]|nr:MAG: hypothetical protein CBC89_04990 [Euryarchaeota archaeon TMED129]|tara:strand:- start:8270 stop:8671 length:402 start_codon:yes stop_codon:yes gene_type:complete